MNLLGPLFEVEFRRLVRKQRPHRVRSIYVFVIGMAVAFCYLAMFPRGPDSFHDFLFRPTARGTDLARFGYVFFCVFASLQFVIAVFMTASWSARTFAEDAERQTLPFLLMTTLSDRELVLGRVAARLAIVWLAVLAGLPVLVVMQFIGGIAPEWILAAFVVTVAGTLSAAGVGARASVRSGGVGKMADGRVTLTVCAYLLILPIVTALVRLWWGNVTVVPGWLTLSDVMSWLNVGNPFWLVSDPSTRNLPLLEQTVRCSSFHLLLAASTYKWVVRRARPTFRRLADGAATKSITVGDHVVPVGPARRPVSQDWPVFWREMYVGPRPRGKRSVISRVVVILAVLSPLIVGGVVAWYLGTSLASFGRGVHQSVFGWGAMALYGTALFMGGSVADSFLRDERKQTLDELFLTRLDNREILGQRGFATAWVVRWVVGFVGSYWLVAWAAGGLHPASFGLALPLYALHTTTAICIGLYFCVRRRGRVKPAVAATLTLMFLAAGPMAILLSAIALFSDRAANASLPFVVGLSPPVTFAVFTIPAHPADWKDWKLVREPSFYCGVAVQVIALAFIAIKAWRGAVAGLGQERRE